MLVCRAHARRAIRRPSVTPGCPRPGGPTPSRHQAARRQGLCGLKRRAPTEMVISADSICYYHSSFRATLAQPSRQSRQQSPFCAAAQTSRSCQRLLARPNFTHLEAPAARGRPLMNILIVTPEAALATGSGGRAAQFGQPLRALQDRPVSGIVLTRPIENLHASRASLKPGAPRAGDPGASSRAALPRASLPDLPLGPPCCLACAVDAPTPQALQRSWRLAPCPRRP